MSQQTDLLSRVISALEARAGSLRDVSKESGIGYDTVRRIRDRKHDPGYSKVLTLAKCLGVQDEPSKVAA